MQRYLLSIELQGDVSIDFIKSHLQSNLSNSKIHVIQKTCILIESTCTIACINNVLQEIDGLENYVLASIASGPKEEGSRTKIYLYPSVPGINDTING